MNGPLLRVGWYRFRATFANRRGGYLSLVLLIGLLGGIAMAAVAGGRRTQSSYPGLLASTNPSDLTTIYGDAQGYDPAIVDALARLPHVRRVESAATLNVLEVGTDGTPIEDGGASANGTAGSVDGLFLNQDRPAVIQGRLPDPERPDEAVTTVEAARELDLHLGSVISLGFYTNEQTLSPDYGTKAVQPYRRADVKLVGIGLLNSSVVEDDSERSGGSLLLTPALTRTLLACCANGALSGLQLDHGSRDVAAVEPEVERALPPDTGFYIRATSGSQDKAERAVKPESVALGVFGGIAALATLLIAGQLLGRQLRLGADELGVLRALGAGPAMTTGDGLVGITGAIVIGSLLAAAVAVGLSPLAPIGPVRPVDPTAGIAFDWTVLGLGVAVLIVALGALAVTLAYRRAPHRAARRQERARAPRSGLARAAGTSGLPVTAVTGIGFALRPGARPDAVPVRSTILGAALAVVVVTATLTFGSSLHT
ncbi:MAG TPA: hypothetical protein VEN99_05935, partial [Acidimicrobiia bacterium]|nr:hypothetical protein [Acidimicrobiia bacterium]